MFKGNFIATFVIISNSSWKYIAPFEMLLQQQCANLACVANNEI